MHKIKKGIKKKIKGKKGKHDDDEIFTEEELEQYKREKAEEALKLAQQQTESNPLDENLEEEFAEQYQEVELGGHESSPPNAEKSGNADWKNFFATTDTVLKETSDNLEHIKEQSVFQTHIPERAEDRRTELSLVEPVSQRASTCVSPVCGAPSRSWVDLEKGGIDDESPAQDYPVEVRPVTPPPPPKKKFVELKPIEDLPEVSAEDYADVFDTAFVDDIEKGDLKLIIPDSPTDEYLNEPDPFDTSVADRVLHIEDPEPEPEAQVILGTRSKVEAPKKRKIQLVSLGNAVDVLTGKAPTQQLQTKENEADEVNLLGEITESEAKKENNSDKNSEDEKSQSENDSNDEDDKESVNKNSEEKTSALDDILFGVDEPLENLPEFVVPIVEKEVKENNSENSKKECDINIDEFLPEKGNISPENNNQSLNLHDLVSEFDVIDKNEVAQEESLVPKLEDDPILDEFDAGFASLAHASIAKAKDKEIEELGVDDGDDPFDTSYIADVIGEKKAPSRPAPPRPLTPSNRPDLLSDDNNTLQEVDPFDTSIAEKVIPVDILQTTENDTDLADTLLPSEVKGTLSHSDSFDPFDTSAADAFGVTELRVLENELLTKSNNQSALNDSDSDFDFDPREGEEPQEKLTPTCLLSSTDGNLEGTVLSPQENQIEDFDPFDTSIADKIQIDSLEELLENTSEKTKVDSETVLQTKLKPAPPPRPVSPSCLLVASPTSEDINPTLQPQTKAEETEQDGDEIDPFDTSIADAYGKTELKVLEAELLTKTTEDIELPETTVKEEIPKKLEVKVPPPRPQSPACLLGATPIDENPTLVPQIQGEDTNLEEEDFDPFDTSIAQQFGKNELQVLESELLEQRPSTQLSNCDDFDPRAVTPDPSGSINKQIPKSQSGLLNETPEIGVPLIQPSDSTVIQSQEEELDPFDTSIAEKLGDNELKHLESEFLNKEVSSSLQISELESSSSNQQCLLATTPTDSSGTLQPFSNSCEPITTTETEDFDPFDTSIANQFGKTEIKELEQELLSSSVTAAPKYPSHLKGIDISAELDPFDTSIAEKALPAGSLTRAFSDDDFDFDPRQEEKKSLPQQTSLLDSTEESDLPQSSVSVLTPQTVPQESSLVEEEEIDPFDTSIAANIVPGKTEIKLLESELL